MKWTLAAKNLRRDRRRSVLTLLSVSLGVTAILLFCAYVQFIEGALARLVIYQDGNAHVQVYLKGGPENLSAFPARFSLTADDSWRVEAAIARAASHAPSGVVRHTAQLMGVGTANHGRNSAIFLARGVDPQADAALRADGGFADASEDVMLPQRADGILLTRQIAELLGYSAGARQDGKTDGDADDGIQLSGATYGNRINAIDVAPAGFFTTGIEAIENKSIKLPLATLQSLYDTDDISRIVVQLRDRADTPAFAAALQTELDQGAGNRYAVTQWNSPQIGQLYQSFMGFANTMFMFTGIVLLLIAVATVQHTIAGNVADRLKEIGMLRSLGFSRDAVIGIFVRESLLLAAAGCALAVLASHAAFHLFAYRFETALPRLSVKVPVALSLPVVASIAVAMVAVAAIVFSSWWTVRRVVRMTTAAPSQFSLAHLAAAVAACWCVALLLPAPDACAAASPPVSPGVDPGAAPSEASMQEWLKRADIARGGFAGYSWTAHVKSVEPAGETDTTYAVAVSDGRALVRTEAPARQAGEKILLDGRAMWYGKRGLRKPVSISPQQRLTGEASNGDIAAVQYARDYQPAYAGEENVDGRNCHVLALSARNGQVAYDAIRYYIDKATLLGVKADFKTASGMVLKTAYFEYGNKVAGKNGKTPFVSRMKIVNASFADRFSEIDYSGVTPAEHPEALFRVDNLLAP
jgi:putative ABC transport system permease protein